MKPLILAYHRVLPAERTKTTLAVSTDIFERQLIYLKQKGYTFIRLKDFRGEAAGKKVCIVTFDDGYKDNYLYAFPILQKLNIPATFFVTTGYIGIEKPYYWDFKNQNSFTKEDYSMDWQEIKKMAGTGMEIGSHTVQHYELDKLSWAEQEQEIKASKRILDEVLGQNTLSISYPRGILPEKLEELLKDSGYLLGVITPGKGQVKRSNYSLERVGVYGHDNFLRFIIKISGWAVLLRRLFK